MPNTWPDGATFRAECDRRGAAAAADIDDPLAGHGLGTVDQNVGDRSQQNVLRSLPVGPAPARRSIPIGDLVGVLFVACRCIHVRHPFQSMCRNIQGAQFSRVAACNIGIT